MADPLRIGRIPFANLFPIFHELKQEAGGLDCEFIDGYPSELNRMLRDGAVDISPSSSVEYLRDKKRYTFLEGHSISSKGPIGSILFFTKVELRDLDGQTVHVTHQSETSVLLLKVVLKRFYGVSAAITVTTRRPAEALKTSNAYLAIGDDALITMKGAGRHGIGDPMSEYSTVTINGAEHFVYDLGDLWHRRTGLPFVFALWVLRKETANRRPGEVRRFKEALEDARDRAFGDLGAAAESCPLRSVLGTSGLIDYWNGISYGLGSEHMKGLRLFENYAQCHRALRN